MGSPSPVRGRVGACIALPHKCEKYFTRKVSRWALTSKRQGDTNFCAPLTPRPLSPVSTQGRGGAHSLRSSTTHTTQLANSRFLQRPHLLPLHFHFTSHFLLPASCFLLPASCFLLPASCFLLPASCLLLTPYSLLLLTPYSLPPAHSLQTLSLRCQCWPYLLARS